VCSRFDVSVLLSKGGSLVSGLTGVFGYLSVARTVSVVGFGGWSGVLVGFLMVAGASCSLCWHSV
jgi:hypothetical protein